MMSSVWMAVMSLTSWIDKLLCSRSSLRMTCDDEDRHTQGCAQAFIHPPSDAMVWLDGPDHHTAASAAAAAAAVHTAQSGQTRDERGWSLRLRRTCVQ
jgi:hypothetical protein